MKLHFCLCHITVTCCNGGEADSGTNATRPKGRTITRSNLFSVGVQVLVGLSFACLLSFEFYSLKLQNDLFFEQIEKMLKTGLFLYHTHICAIFSIFHSRFSDNRKCTSVIIRAPSQEELSSRFSTSYEKSSYLL